MRLESASVRPGPLAAFLGTAAVSILLSAGALAQTSATPAPRLLDAGAARALGYQAGWQSRLPILAGGALAGMRFDGPHPGDDAGALFAWDDEGVILKVDPATGDLRWQSASIATKGGKHLVDVNVAATGTKTLAVGLGDTKCLTLEERTGSELGQTRYEHIPVTESIRSGPDLVFGSRGGHVVWMGFRDEQVPSRVTGKPGDQPQKETRVAAVHTFAYEEQAHQLRGSIQARPVAAGAMIIACSTNGQIASFSKLGRNRVWSIDLPGGIVATPATDGTQLFVACRDQYLRCIDAEKGRTKWKWFCESPLENPPLLAGDLVMLQVPDLGLVALDASDQGGLTREPRWKSKAAGNPITRLVEGVVVWDKASSTLSLVDDATGIVRESRTLPGVTAVQASAATRGDLYLMSSDGRLQRCAPISGPATAPAVTGDESAQPAETAKTEETAPASGEAAATSTEEPTPEPPMDPAGA
jgi:outer membrane protein assembly factor BamB